MQPTPDKYDKYEFLVPKALREITAHPCTLSFFSIRIYFIRTSRLKFAKFKENFKNKAKAEILKRIDISFGC